MRGKLNTVRKLSAVVPYGVVRQGNGACVVFGAVTAGALEEAIRYGIDIERYPVDPAAYDFMLAGPDSTDRERLTSVLNNATLLAYEDKHLLMAIERTPDLDGIMRGSGHGELCLLYPSAELFLDGGTEKGEAEMTVNSYQMSFLRSIDVKRLVERVEIAEAALGPESCFPPCPMTAAEFQSTVDRYSGVAPLDAAGTGTNSAMW